MLPDHAAAAPSATVPLSPNAPWPPPGEESGKTLILNSPAGAAEGEEQSPAEVERLIGWAQQKADEQRFHADDEHAPHVFRKLCRENAANFAAIATALIAHQ